MRLCVGLLVIVLSACDRGAPPTAPTEPHPVSPPVKSLEVETIQDPLKGGGVGPELVVIPAGEAKLGDITGSSILAEGPIFYDVVIKKPFALGRFEVTFEEYDAFCEATQRPKPDDAGWGRGKRPVINVSWEDVQAYVAWLSENTGKHYFIPSEAQWEYAARAGSSSNYWWGDDIGENKAQCGDCMAIHRCSTYGDTWEKCLDKIPKKQPGTVPVGSFEANAFGLYDVLGNVLEFTADCSDDLKASRTSYGEPVTSGDCSMRITKGGAWGNSYKSMLLGDRFTIPVLEHPSYGSNKSNANGFRVAREIE
jgi:formylglycine-generating enzyme required for sulfatase activity